MDGMPFLCLKTFGRLLTSAIRVPNMSLSKHSFQELKVLLLEDSMDLRDQLSRILQSSKMGFSVETIPGSVGLNKKLTFGKYDILVIDYDLAVGDASSIVKTAKEIDPFLPVVIVSRNFADSIHLEAAQMGADSYIPLTSVSLRMFPSFLMKRIENSSLVRKTNDSSHQSMLKSYQIEILGSLVRKMVETNDLKSVMQELAEQVVKKLDMKVVSLQRYFPRQRGFAVYGIYPQGKLIKFAQMFFGISLDSFVFPFDPENCIVDRYTAERKPWVGTDFADVFGATMSSQAARMIQKFAGVKSVYNAPFYSKDQLLGGIVVGNVRASFADEELEAFDAIVHISSLLFEYNESVKSQIVQNEKLQAIHETSSQLHENLEPAKLFDIIHEKLNAFVPSDIVRLFLYDDKKKALIEEKILMRKGKRPHFIVSEIPLGKGLIGKAALGNLSLLENNAHLNPLSIYASERPELEHLLAVPITHHGELLGSIALTRMTDEPFVESDLDALEIFTSQFATALHNSRLYENLLRSESLYRLVLENVNDPVVFIGTDGRLLFVNPKFEEVSGYSSEEVLGKKFGFLVYPDDLSLVANRYRERMSGKEVPNRYEFRIIRKSGEVRTIDYNVTTIAEGGKPTGLLGVARDVTDDHIAREKLKQKTQQLQTLLDTSASLMHSEDTDELLEKLITSAKEAVAEADGGSVLIYDKTKNKLRMSASVGYPKELKESFELALNEGWGGKVFASRTSTIIEDASLYPIPGIASKFPIVVQIASGIAVPLLVDDEVLGVISLDNFSSKNAFGLEQLQFLEGFAHQAALALRKAQMHSDLKESESRYRTITESSSDLIVVTDDDGRIEFCNFKFAHTFSLRSELIIGRKLADFLEESSRESVIKIIKTVGHERKHRVTAVIDGLRHHFDVVSKTIKTGSGQSRQILFLNDVSDAVRTNDWMEKAYEVGLKRTGAELFESYANLLSEVFNIELVYIGDYDDANDVSLAHVMKIRDNFLHTLKVGHVQKLLDNDQNGIHLIDKLAPSESGWRSFYASEIEVDKKCVGVIILASERTQRISRTQMSILQLVRQRLAFEYERQKKEVETRRLEEQLRHSQKMESLGTLAGGVAHDFNNILGAILGYAGLLRIELNQNEKLTKYLDTIERSAQRAAELTRQLLGFARAGKTTVKSLDFNGICVETAEMTKKIIEKNVEVSLELEDGLPAVEGDESQLSQVVMNLVVNARDAMPNGGKLKIVTSHLEADEIVRLKLNLEKKDYVVVEVSDTGHGISKENLSRIFEPFFTTKPKGKGTGLGLSMVYGIVKNHGGEIEAESEVGKGTTLRIYFPATSEEAGANHHREPSEIKRIVKDKLCLVVDDEIEMRDLLTESLARLGFSVVAVDGGEKAIEILKKNLKVDVVILDMIMPGMDGSETYFRIHKSRPELPVLVSTGYSSEGKVQDILNNGGMGVLHKPFTLEELQSQLANKFQD